MSQGPIWNGRIYKQAKFGDMSIQGTVKAHDRGLRTKRATRSNAEAYQRELIEIEMHATLDCHGRSEP